MDWANGDCFNLHGSGLVLAYVDGHAGRTSVTLDRLKRSMSRRYVDDVRRCEKVGFIVVPNLLIIPIPVHAGKALDMGPY